MAKNDPTLDASSVYYLHPSDHTGLKLVSQVFDGVGYGDWKREMVLALTSKNKIGFVDGSLKKPATASEEFNAWIRCDSMIIGWIVSNLGVLIARSVHNLKTAREIWVDLEERFGQGSAAQLYSLNEEWTSLSQDSSMTVAEYYTRAKVIWDEIDSIVSFPTCQCNGCTCTLTQKFLKLQQDQRLIEFLMKLHENFAQIRSNILMMTPLPNISQAYRIFVAEQKHKEIGKQSPVSNEALGFATERNTYYNKHPHSTDSANKYKGSSSG